MHETFVFDTNVLLKAAFSSQSGAFAAFKKANERGLLLYSEETFSELEDKIMLPKFDRYASRSRRRAFLELYQKTALNVPNIQPVVACRDPKDDKFLALVVTAAAICIVSHDLDLLVLHPFLGIPILTSGAFLQEFS